MVRGLYTAASGMMAQWENIDVISNNLANVDHTAFKRDVSVFKSFPEMLIRRMSDDGVVQLPLGSYDIGPVVGKLGTGVELNKVFTNFDQGNGLKLTGNDFDLALEGKGFFTVMTPQGELYSRNGSFLLDSQGYIVTKDGYKVKGVQNEAIQVKAGNFKVDEFGQIWVNDNFKDAHPGAMVDGERNGWESARMLDQLKVVNFYDERELKKVGNSFYAETRYSGKGEILGIGHGRPKVHQGYLEASNVNPVLEMIKMIEVQRTYEACQKALTSHDELLGRVISQLGIARA